MHVKLMSSLDLFPYPFTSPLSSPLHLHVFIIMRKLFIRDKPKLEEVTSDLTLANSSEVITFMLF